MAQKFGLKAKTRLTFDEFDTLVGRYTRGEYHITLGGLDDLSKIKRKIMIVWFDLEEDRQRVKALFNARTRPQPAATGSALAALTGAE